MPDAGAWLSGRSRQCGRSVKGNIPGNGDIPGNEGVGEHVRTRFHAGPQAQPKLRIVKDTRTERRKTCFFCRTGFEGAKLWKQRSSKYDPAV